MAYIQPNSRIEFFDDIGLSQDYNDTLYFPTVAQKDAYFDNIQRLAHVDKCYYARENRGFVRVELPMNTLIHAQYMRFKNTSYENKWWYAFVTDVNYINDNTTEVQFELDPMLSWMGAFTLADCFVERQHGETDEIGDNLVDEPLDTGEYVVISDDVSGYMDDWVYVVFYTPTVASTLVIPDNHVFNQLGIYSGLQIQIFDDDRTSGSSSPTGLTQLHNFLLNDPVNINVQMIMHVPEKFIPKIANYTPFYTGQTDYSSINREYAPISNYDKYVTRNTALAGSYQPDNNKLFTYPYNFFTVWNGEDKENEYRYELFDLDLVTGYKRAYFKILSSVGEPTEAMCVPMAYRGISLNYPESSTMRDFSPASWVSDAFMAYLAQFMSSAPTRLLAGLAMDNLTMAANAANVGTEVVDTTIDKGSTISSSASFGGTGNVVSTDVVNKNYKTIHKTKPVGHQKPPIGGVLAIRGVLLDGFTHLTNASSVHGKPSNTILEVEQEKDFWFFQKSVRPEYAEIIDGYFTMFGYAQKKVMQPKMHVRTRFTYVKTRDCKINCYPSCPASDANFIEELFNKGIRFWVDHTDIGNYSSPNPCLTPST